MMSKETLDILNAKEQSWAERSKVELKDVFNDIKIIKIKVY